MADEQTDEPTKDEPTKDEPERAPRREPAPRRRAPRRRLPSISVPSSLSPAAAQQTVVVSFVIVLASVYVGAIAQGQRPTARPVVGVAVGGAILLAGASSPRFAPLASKFSALIATTAILTSGFYAARALGRYYAAAGSASEPYTPPTS